MLRVPNWSVCEIDQLVESSVNWLKLKVGERFCEFSFSYFAFV